MEVNKGFVSTLEAVISSTVILGMLLASINYFSVTDAGLNPEERVHRGLVALDTQGELEGDLEELENKVTPYIPSDYNHSVNVIKVDRSLRSEQVSPGNPYVEHFNKDERYAELKLWTSSNNGINVSFSEETVVEDLEETGYFEFPLENSEGELNITGDAELDISLEAYPRVTDIAEGNNLRTVSYITTYNNTVAELRVSIWR